MSDDIGQPPNHLPGEALMNALFKRAREQGQSIGDMAKELGVSHAYLSLLRSGQRQIPNVNDEFSTACAKYLGMPRIYVLLLAEKLKSDDFYGAAESGMHRQLSNALRMVTDSEEAARAGVSAEDINKLPARLQYLMVQLYQGAHQLQLLPREFDIDEVTSIADVHAKRRDSAL